MRIVHFTYNYDISNVTLLEKSDNLDIDEYAFYITMEIAQNNYDLYNTKVHLYGETSGIEMDIPLENVDLENRIIEVVTDLIDSGFVNDENIDVTITLQVAQEVNFSWSSQDTHQISTSPSNPHLFLNNPYEITFSINDEVDGEFALTGTYVYNNGHLDEWAQNHITYSSDHRSIIVKIFRIDGSIHIDLPLIIDPSVNTFVLGSATFTFDTLKNIKIVKNNDTPTGENVIIFYEKINGWIGMVTTNIPHASNKKIVGFSLEANSDKVFVLYNEDTYCKISSSITLYPILEDKIPVTPSSFSITFYNNRAEINKVDKRNDLTIGTNIQGTLRDSCSVQSPSIIIEMATQTFYEKGWNYVYIEMFKRYYFITSITSIKKDLWQIDLKEDVLMSFKKEIWYQNGLIARNQYDFNEDLIDNERLVETEFVTSKVDVNDRLFSLGTNTSYLSDKTCVVALAEWITNIISSTGSYEYNEVTEKKHGQSNHFTPFTNLYTITMNNLHRISKALITGDYVDDLSHQIYADASEYITSITSYPFLVNEWMDVTSSERDIYIGETRLTDGTSAIQGQFVYEMKQRFYIFHIDRYFNNFMDFAPYTTLRLYIPYVDYVDLPTNIVMDKDIRVGYAIDFFTATLHVTISVKKDDEWILIMTANGQVGAEIPIGRTNAIERKRTRELHLINRVVGVVNTGIGAIASLGNKENRVAGVITKGISGAINLLGQQKVDAITNNQEHYSGGKISGDFSGEYLPQRAFLQVTRPKPIPIDENYAKLKGKPLGEYRTLSALHGFTIVDEIHLTGFDTATDDEITEIENLLRAGVHL